MIKWLFTVIVGWPWCAHHWTIIDQRRLDTDIGATGQRYYLQCDKCGDVKKRDLV